MSLFGPIAAVFLPPLVATQFGAFEDFVWVGKQVKPWEAFGILGAMLYPVAAYSFALMQGEIEQARLSRDWPAAAGTLDAINVEKRYVYRVGYRYIVTVNYSYVVAGRRYTGDRLAFAPRLLAEGDELNRVTDKYKVNQPVTVHYNPATPEESVLETSDALARQRQTTIYLLAGLPPFFALVLLIFG